MIRKYEDEHEVDLSSDTDIAADRIKHHRGEFYGLILFSTVGMMFLASAGELISLYVGLELTTIPLFVLAAFYKDNKLSVEAGLKYFIIGAFSSAILVYGISLLYGMTGATDISGTTALQYDNAGCPVRVDFPSGHWFTYTCDGAGRRTQRVSDDGHTLNYTYDAAGRLERVADSGGTEHVAYEIGRDGLSRSFHDDVPTLHPHSSCSLGGGTAEAYEPSRHDRDSKSSHGSVSG